MIIATEATCRFSSKCFFGAVLLITGCGKSDDHSNWIPDPALTSQLTQKATLGKYEMLLPKELIDAGAKADLPGQKTFRWKRQSGPSGVLALIITIDSEKQLTDEGKKNMRQYLVNMSAGITDKSGISIAQREKTETGSFCGIDFSRFKWSGSTRDQVPVLGMAYGGIDGANLITIHSMSFGVEAETERRLMETAVATFKRQ